MSSPASCYLFVYHLVVGRSWSAVLSELFGQRTVATNHTDLTCEQWEWTKAQCKSKTMSWKSFAELRWTAAWWQIPLMSDTFHITGTVMWPIVRIEILISAALNISCCCRSGGCMQAGFHAVLQNKNNNEKRDDEPKNISVMSHVNNICNKCASSKKSVPALYFHF